jgi:hypothetical protein
MLYDRPKIWEYLTKTYRCTGIPKHLVYRDALGIGIVY